MATRLAGERWEGQTGLARVGGRGGLIRGAGLDPPLRVDPNSRAPVGPGPSPLSAPRPPLLSATLFGYPPAPIFWNHAGTDSSQPHRRSSNHLAFVAYCPSHCTLLHLLVRQALHARPFAALLYHSIRPQFLAHCCPTLCTRVRAHTHACVCVDLRSTRWGTAPTVHVLHYLAAARSQPSDTPHGRCTVITRQGVRHRHAHQAEAPA